MLLCGGCREAHACRSLVVCAGADGSDNRSRFGMGGLQWTVVVGSILQAYGASAIAIVCWLAWRPALGVLATAAGFVALLPVQFTSFVYLIAVADTRSPSQFSREAADAADSASGAIVVLGAVFQELFRAIFCYAIVCAEWYFRERGQVLYATRYRILPCGLAAGVGYGATLSLLSYGALLQAAVENFGVGKAGLAFLNIDACPQLPFLYFQGLAWFFAIVAQAAWTGLMTVGMAAIVEPTTGTVMNPSSGRSPASPTPQRSRRATPTSGRRTPGSQSTSPPPTPPVPIPRPTSLRKGEGFGLVGAVVVTHLVFSCVSLVNSGAFNRDTFESVAGRGCATSLPIQGVLAALSVAVVGLVAKLDVIKRIDVDDI